MPNYRNDPNTITAVLSADEYEEMLHRHGIDPITHDGNPVILSDLEFNIMAEYYLTKQEPPNETNFWEPKYAK